MSLFSGVVFLIFLEKDKKTIDIFFDVTSALSNVGLSSGITVSTMHIASKIVMIFLMWLGRLEIVPVIVFVLSFFYASQKK